MLQPAKRHSPWAACCILQTSAGAVAAASSDTVVPAKSTNIAGIDLALLVDQLTRTGSSPEMTATILSTLVATSPDAGPDEQKQILQKLTEALRERQRQIELQKLAAVSGTGAVSSSTATTTVAAAVTASAITVSAVPAPVNAVIAELTTKPNEPLFSKASSATTAPAVSITTPVISVAPSSAVVPGMQQCVSTVPCSSTVNFSAINVSALSTLPVSLPTTSAAAVLPSATSALPPAVQQMLSGQSFENLKNILANVTGRKAGGTGAQNQSSVASTGSTARTVETLDSYTTSKGSRSDLQKMAPESDVQPQTSSEPDELFLANIHGDVDYRVRPALPAEPPKSIPPFPVSQPGWIRTGNQLPLPRSAALQQPDGRYVGGGDTRSLLPAPFSQNSNQQSNTSSGGPLFAVPPRSGKPQALLPTPEKPSGQREERGRDNQEGRRQKSEDTETHRDEPRYKDRRPYDDRSSSREDQRHRRSSRERSDIDRRSERQDGRRSTDRSVTQKSSSSLRGGEERSGTQVTRSEEEPIIIDDDCEDIPLPPTTAPSKSSDTSAPPAETSTSKNQNFDADRKVLLPTPNKQVSSGEKRKSDDSRREQKFSRSWEHRRSLKSPPSSSKGASETKGKKALLETPVASASSEPGRVSDSAGAKDSRTVKCDSDSKSYERRRSRSKSRTRSAASSLLDRSRRKLGLMRRQRSSSRDRRHSSSRATVAHDARRRSRSRERPVPRSASRDQLQEEEHRLRKQLDDLMARRNNEGNRSKDRQFSPSCGQDQHREQSSRIPSIFNVMQNSDSRANAAGPFTRRHLLPAPHLVSAGNLKGSRPLLQPPVLPRPLLADSALMSRSVDRDRGTHYGQPADQPLLPTTAMLPGQPFVQEYSHKPAEVHVDQFRYGDGTDHTNSLRNTEPGRPAFHEELGQHRYRPYPAPEDRHRMPPESTEQGRNWQIRDRPNEEMNTSLKASDFSDVTRMPAGTETVGLSEATSSEHPSPAFSAAEQNSAVCQPAQSTRTPSPAIYTAAKPELPTGDVLLPPSSAAGTFSADDSSMDKPDEQTADTEMMAENQPALAIPNLPHPPCPPLPIPPNFPAFLEHVRNMMFLRGSMRVPFDRMPGPRMRGPFRPPPPTFPVAPISAPSVHQGATPLMTLPNRPPVPLTDQGREVSFPVKKTLLGDYPGNKQTPALMAEVTADIDADNDTRPECVEPQHGEELQVSEEQQHRQEVVASHLVAPPRLMKLRQPENTTPNSQLPLDAATGEETGKDLFQADEGESTEIPPLMDFRLYKDRPSAQGARPPQFCPPLMRVPPPNVRSRMLLPQRGMLHGLRVVRPVFPGLQAETEIRGSGRPATFPRRGGPSFTPRGVLRHPQYQGAPPE